jgi:hypothetical protein
MNIEVDASQVTFKPSLRQYTITGLTQTGYTYQIKVRAYNANGYSDSPTLYAILAAAPDKPSSGPISDASVTNQHRIKVNYGPQPASENGGSAILTYELQIDNGYGGGFTSLIGGEGAENSLETSYLIEQGIIGGNIYRFRFRSRNINGWSEFSEVVHIKAATIPIRPAAPTFL